MPHSLLHDENTMALIPAQWATYHIKKPSFFFRDNNKRTAYTAMMSSLLISYQQLLTDCEAIREPGLADINKLSGLLSLQKQLRLLDHKFDVTAPVGFFNRVLRQISHLFLSKTQQVIKSTAMTTQVINSRIDTLRQQFESKLYVKAQQQLLNTTQFTQTDKTATENFELIERYDQILEQHQVSWQSAALKKQCRTLAQFNAELQSQSLQEINMQWLITQDENDYQLLKEFVSYLSQCVTPLLSRFMDVSTLKQAEKLLTDWSQWSHQVFSELEPTSPTALKLCALFRDTALPFAVDAQLATNGIYQQQLTTIAANTTKEEPTSPDVKSPLRAVDERIKRSQQRLAKVQQQLAESEALLQECQGDNAPGALVTHTPQTLFNHQSIMPPIDPHPSPYDTSLLSPNR